MGAESLKQIKENLRSLIENIDKNINSLYKIATYDPKTGLHNYRFFSELFDIEFEKAKRGEKLSLVILDIDNFKQINTKYGHTKADEFLVKIARILEKCIRKSDIVARFGGEEFVILLPNTTSTKARRVAERIRKAVRKELKKFNITISGGISKYKKRDTKTRMKQRADRALRQAKKTKNKVVS
jgi:diguanylate cyclase (GGDEF)-like protein